MIAGASVLTSLARWWLGLTAVALGALYWTSGASGGPSSLPALLEVVLSRLALTFPFAAFAGGVGAAHSERPTPWRVVGPVVPLCGLVYGLAAFAMPSVEYSAATASPGYEAWYPFGPATPPALVAIRERAEASDEPYVIDAEQPLRQPPNWVTYQVHQPIAFTLFALPNALLGLLFGQRSARLSAPRRRQARWLAGLVVGLTFLAAAFPASAWVRASPDNSALLGAWAPLFVPVAWLLLLSILPPGVGRRLHAPASTDV